MIRILKKELFSARRKKKFKTFYGQFIKENDLCFDIGANVGNRTEVFLALKGRVVSAEPVDESYLELKKKFGDHPKATLLQVGLGSEAGKKEMHISNISEVCTFSEKFIEKYKNQDKFNIEWNETRVSEIITLDQLVERFGVPVFCKIDVEGYELEVLKGLSQPMPLISFEYNAKLKKLALECIGRLCKFRSLSYNFSPYESMAFTFEVWKNEIEFREFIRTLPNKVKTGDIYVRSE